VQANPNNPNVDMLFLLGELPAKNKQVVFQNYQ
jgi:hypothetical protein